MKKKIFRVDIETKIPNTINTLSEPQKNAFGEELIISGLNKIMNDVCKHTYGVISDETMGKFAFKHTKKTIFVLDKNEGIHVGRIKIINLDGKIKISFYGNKMYKVKDDK